MQLIISTAFEMKTIDDVIKIKADGAFGRFCILPRHIDICMSIEPCVLEYTSVSSHVSYCAIDEGILVKKSKIVYLAVKREIDGKDLGFIKKEAMRNISALEDNEKNTRAGIARLEYEFARRIAEMK
jgi:F-type H+-transporting ATPase subunit epsilon